MVNKENLSGKMTSTDYLDQFYNEELLKQLQSRPLSEIEELLKHYEEKYDFFLRSKKGNEKLRLFRKKEISELLTETKETLHSFLDLPNISEPKVVLSPFLKIEEGEYDIEKQTIHVGTPSWVEDWPSAKAAEVITFAHEYSHHITHCTLHPVPPHHFRLMDEGISLGLERVAADVFSERYHARGFQHFALKPIIESLEFANNWLKSTRRNLPEHNLLTRGECYDLGSTTLALLEAERGTDIYRQILHGEFRW